MAFNIIAETDKKIDFDRLHKKVYSENFSFDFVPMPGLGLNGGDAIGICIPLNNANEETWKQLKPVLKKLKSEFNCNVYDLYGGQNLDFFNIGTLKEPTFKVTCTTANIRFSIIGDFYFTPNAKPQTVSSVCLKFSFFLLHSLRYYF